MRRAMPFVLAALTAGSLLAQSRALNPTVKVDPRAKSAVPVECEEGAVPQPTPRLQVAEIPQESTLRADMQPPRSNDLRAQFRDLHASAERNDREGFKQLLEVVRATVAAYPPGGEKSAASEALTVYGDVDRLWDHQFTSPTGAFFDANDQDGALLKMLSGYRGFEDAIRRNVIVDANGNRFYPARESREFLLREAAQRLTRLGVKPGAPAIAAVPPPAVVTPVIRPETTTPRVTKPAETAPAGARATKPAARKRVRSASAGTTTKPAAARRPRRSAPSASPAKAAPAEEPPLPPGVVSAPVDTADPAPAQSSSTSTAVNESVPQASATAPLVTETAVASTESVQPAESPRPTAAQNAARSRNIIMPLVLILIGVGVLVILFRASS